MYNGRRGRREELGNVRRRLCHVRRSASLSAASSDLSSDESFFENLISELLCSHVFPLYMKNNRDEIDHLNFKLDHFNTWSFQAPLTRRLIGNGSVRTRFLVAYAALWHWLRYIYQPS
jgi:hypothetical protein